jgi:hypothetical protein
MPGLRLLVAVSAFLVLSGCWMTNRTPAQILSPDKLQKEMTSGLTGHISEHAVDDLAAEFERNFRDAKLSAPANHPRKKRRFKVITRDGKMVITEPK